MILLLGQALKSLVEHRQHGLHRQVTHNSPPTPPLPNHKTSPVAHSTITQCSRPAEFTNKIKLDPRSTTNKQKPEMAPTWVSRDRQPSVLFNAQWTVSWLYTARLVQHSWPVWWPQRTVPRSECTHTIPQSIKSTARKTKAKTCSNANVLVERTWQIMPL